MLTAYLIEIEEHDRDCRWWASFCSERIGSGVVSSFGLALETAQHCIDEHAGFVELFGVAA